MKIHYQRHLPQRARIYGSYEPEPTRSEFAEFFGKLMGFFGWLLFAGLIAALLASVVGLPVALIILAIVFK